MSLLKILQWIAAAATVLTGLFSLFFPRSVQGFTGLRADSGRGITEIRTVLGGFFAGLGLATLMVNNSTAFLVLGIGYLVMAVVRAVSILVDRSVETSNIISLIAEIILGVILVL
jgi:hypothetical protein